jgi:transcription antitermination factor NusG
MAAEGLEQMPSIDIGETYPWFALYIRQRLREKCEEYLQSRSYDIFSPVRTEIHRWSDRNKAIDVPLFPGYLFCRFDPQKSAPILATPGVSGIINSGGKFLEVNPEQLENVRKSLDSGLPIEVVPDFVRGQRVRIISGAMAGIEGVLSALKNQIRVGLEVTMMNRSILVEVSPSQVVAI